MNSTNKSVYIKNREFVFGYFSSLLLIFFFVICCILNHTGHEKLGYFILFSMLFRICNVLGSRIEINQFNWITTILLVPSAACLIDYIINLLLTCNLF